VDIKRGLVEAGAAVPIVTIVAPVLGVPEEGDIEISSPLASSSSST
jgi:hypothetical protein